MNIKFSTILVVILALSTLVSCGTPSSVKLQEQHYSISGSTLAGSIEIERAELVLGTGGGSITLSPSDILTPKLQLNYRGTGMFIANWKVDGQIIERVNILLGHGSRLALSLKPTTRLATFEYGRHTLQLEIVAPAVTLPAIQTHFFVTQKQ